VIVKEDAFTRENIRKRDGGRSVFPIHIMMWICSWTGFRMQGAGRNGPFPVIENGFLLRTALAGVVPVTAGFVRRDGRYFLK